MEVHAHTHAVPIAIGRKKWTQYLWEFLMLFLAVFCGFLAENLREHYVEQQRAKQYMSAMAEDLKQDTAQIAYSVSLFDSLLVPAQDFALSALYMDKLSDSIIEKMYELVPLSLQNFSFTFQDQTTQQLKNSGNLRLIRKKEVTDGLADYWYQCDQIKNVLLPEYQQTKRNIKEMIFSLFDFGNYTNKYPGSLVENPKLRFLSNDLLLFKRLGNYISDLRFQMVGFLRSNLQNAKEKATRLIILIQKEYHLK